MSNRQFAIILAAAGLYLAGWAVGYGGTILYLYITGRL